MFDFIYIPIPISVKTFSDNTRQKDNKVYIYIDQLLKVCDTCIFKKKLTYSLDKYQSSEDCFS